MHGPAVIYHGAESRYVYNLVSAMKSQEQKIPSLLSSVPHTGVLAQVMHMCTEASGSGIRLVSGGCSRANVCSCY